METLYPGSYQLEPMKYNGKPSQALIDEAFKGNGQWVAQQKYDGALYMLEKIDDDHIFLFALWLGLGHILPYAKHRLMIDRLALLCSVPY